MNAPKPDFVEFVTPIGSAIPPEVEATFAECVRVGLYSEADRESLREMHRIDPEATRGLVAEMAERIDRCSRCCYLRRSSPASAHCIGRDTNALPADRGEYCSTFAPAARR